MDEDGRTRSNGHGPEEHNWNRFRRAFGSPTTNTTTTAEEEEEEDIIISISAHPLLFRLKFLNNLHCLQKKIAKFSAVPKLLRMANSSLRALKANGIFMQLDPGFDEAEKNSVDW